MPKFVKKPVVIEAIQFNGFKEENGQVNLSERPEWLTSEFGKKVMFFDKQNTLTIKTLEGNMIANLGDWIIKGVNGEFYPIKSEIFFKTYDVVENSERPQTFGEKAVGITFNPSGSDEVYEAKMLAAKQIDLLEKVHIKLANTSWVRNVLRTQAFNLLVSAQMALVKYITWKD